MCFLIYSISLTENLYKHVNCCDINCNFRCKSTTCDYFKDLVFLIHSKRRNLSFDQLLALWISFMLLFSQVSGAVAQIPLQPSKSNHLDHSQDQPDYNQNYKSEHIPCKALSVCFRGNADQTCAQLRLKYICLLHWSCRGNLLFELALTNGRLQLKRKGCEMVTSEDVSNAIQSNNIDSVKNQLDVSIDAKASVCTSARAHTDFNTCALFGDTHLRDYSGALVTCALEGAWPLIDNQYITVQASGRRVPGATYATGLTLVTIIVKRDSICIEPNFLSYTARAELPLPSTFSPGYSSAGKDLVVAIRVSEDSQRAEIWLRHLNFRLILRRVVGFLSLTLRWPAAFAQLLPHPILQPSVFSTPKLQLCLTGCPLNEHLSIPSGTRRNFNVTIAERKCADANLHGVFLDSCVFDLMASGDITFVQASVFAQVDMIDLEPNAPELFSNRTTFQSLETARKRFSGISQSDPHLLLNNPKSGSALSLHLLNLLHCHFIAFLLLNALI